MVVTSRGATDHWLVSVPGSGNPRGHRVRIYTSYSVAGCNPFRVQVEPVTIIVPV